MKRPPIVSAAGPRPFRASAMSRVQEAMGARFKDDAGWRVAEVYTSVDDEVAGTRRGVGLCDVSACGKLGVRGEDLDALGVKLTGRPVPAVGLAARAALNGTPLLVCRRARDEALVLMPPSDTADVAAALGHAVAGSCVHVTDLTSAFAAVDLLGARLGTVLERLVPLDLSAVPVLGVVQAELARVHATILRLDVDTLPAFRVLVGREHGDFVWRALGEAGHDLGLTLVGAAAHARLVSA